MQNQRSQGRGDMKESTMVATEVAVHVQWKEAPHFFLLQLSQSKFHVRRTPDFWEEHPVNPDFSRNPKLLTSMDAYLNVLSHDSQPSLSHISMPSLELCFWKADPRPPTARLPGIFSKMQCRLPGPTPNL
jgi:hypothetical protein